MPSAGSATTVIQGTPTTVPVSNAAIDAAPLNEEIGRTSGGRSVGGRAAVLAARSGQRPHIGDRRITEHVMTSTLGNLFAQLGSRKPQMAPAAEAPAS